MRWVQSSRTLFIGSWKTGVPGIVYIDIFARCVQISPCPCGDLPGADGKRPNRYDGSNSIRRVSTLNGRFRMDEKLLFENLAQELIREWDVIPTGSGFLIMTDWRLPNDERIEIQVRTVGERDDLYVVTDGGNLFNFLFAEGVSLDADETGRKILNGVMKRYGSQFVDYQIVKGANDETLAGTVKSLLEAVKDASLLLWHKLSDRKSIH